MGLHNIQNLWIAAAASAAIFLLSWSFTGPWQLRFSSFPNLRSDVVSHPKARIQTGQESNDPTFYDDDTAIYSIDEPVIEWDHKRSLWFKLHPTFSPSENRLLVVTGSSPSPCTRDYLLLRSFKNKVDYCRMHACSVFYSNALLSHWAVIRAAMAAHPQVEWLLWAGPDAVFTDMEAEIPVGRYKGRNLVVHGWPDVMGVLLIRNCEWSMELLDVRAGMGPNVSDYRKWGEILKSSFREMIHVENNGRGVVGRFDELGGEYMELEKQGRRRRRRRHAEAVSGRYAAEEGGWIVTEFTGCGSCSGEHDDLDSCTVGMERALNYADSQVLRNYGFVHPELGNSSLVIPLSSDHSHTRPRFEYRLY